VPANRGDSSWLKWQRLRRPTERRGMTTMRYFNYLCCLSVMAIVFLKMLNDVDLLLAAVLAFNIRVHK
jgi:hypothetical protein